MNDMPRLDSEELIRRISRDLADSYDEELEMETEDRHPLPGFPRAPMARRRRPIGSIISASCFDCRRSW